MGFLRGFGLVVLSFLLFLSLIVLIFASSFNVMLYPGVYEKAFDKSNVYSILENQSIGSNIQFINGNEAELKNTIDGLVVNGLSYIRGDSDYLNLTVGIDQNNLRAFFEESIKNLSICSYKQDPYGDRPCKPYNMNSSQYLDGLIERRNISLLEEKNINLANLFDKDNNLSKLRDVVKIYRTLLLSLVILSVIFVIFIFVIKRRELKSAFRWNAAVFLASSIVGFFINFGKIFVLSNINLPSELSVFRDSIVVVLDSVFGRIFVYSLIALLISIVLFAFSFFVGKKDKK